MNGRRYEPPLFHPGRYTLEQLHKMGELRKEAEVILRKLRGRSERT